jgi:hypothetical protein
MITPSFGLTATERVLPRLALDFTTASLDGRITFTRSGNTATVTNSSGVIAGINADLPRFDYDPVTLACKGLLIEESRTNHITYTSDLSQAAWIKLNLTFDANAAISPSGANDAFKLKKDATTSTSNVRQVGVASATGIYTASTYAKKAEWNFLYMSVTGSSTNGVAFDLTTGAATPFGTGATGSAVEVGNGWWRCSVTHTLAAQDATNTNQPRPTAAGATALGNGSDGVYIWGPQLEAGAFATSYIPTTTTALTRNADVATITGTNFSDFWQATKGGASVLATPSTVSGVRPLVQFDDNTADNIIALRGNTTNPELYIKATTDQATIDAGTIAANTAYRLAGTWATDNCAASLNSGTAVLDSSATIPTVTQARLGSDGTNYLNGHLQSVEYYNERILNSNLQVVSSPAGYRSIIGPVLRDSIIT